MITIIIPCLNEKKNIKLIKKNLSLFNKSNHIIVDGKSRDNSRKFYSKEKLNFTITTPSRGLQLKKGAEESNTKWLLFLHADTKLNKKNILEIYNFMSFRNAFKAGFFKMEYRKKNFWGTGGVTFWVIYTLFQKENPRNLGFMHLILFICRLL